MDQGQAELENKEVQEHLFKDEAQYQSRRIYLYSGLVVFTVLLVLTFLALNTGLAFALTCGVSIGISSSMLLLSVMRIGTKTFWIYFAWFLGVLLGFSYFGMPQAVLDALKSIGIYYELMIIGCLLQVALFFVYVAYQQCKDFKRTVLNLDSSEVRIDKAFTQKKEIKKKPKKVKKGVLRKKFSVKARLLSKRKENSTEPEIFLYYRYVATKVCLTLTGLAAIYFFLSSGLGALMAFGFFAMFSLAFSFMLIQMIKPGSKSFWIGVGAFLVFVVPVFAYFVNP